MESPKVSVVIPVYNTERFLDESISSVLNQTLDDFELIIINDCSTDDSLNIIKKYMKKDKRIKFIGNKKNLGVAKAMNEGLKAAKGKYIAILGSDDIFLPNKLLIQYNYLEKNPHIFLVGSSAIYINEKGKEIRRFRKYDDYKMLAWRLTKSCSFIHSSILVRNTHEFWYNEEFKSAVDYNYYLDLLKARKNLTNIPPFLVKYRVHSSSISGSKQKEQEFFRDKAREMHNDLRKKTKLSDKLIFSVKLLLFHLKTFNEKRIKN